MDNSQINKLGRKIKELRNLKGWSQDALARRANIPYTTLTKVEIGVIKKPSVYTIAKIAKVFQIPIESLLS